MIIANKHNNAYLRFIIFVFSVDVIRIKYINNNINTKTFTPTDEIRSITNM